MSLADSSPDLPRTFTYSEARRAGLSDRRLRVLRESGTIESVGRGLYRAHDDNDLVDLDLVEIVARAPETTICLASALSRHGLIDLIPAAIDVAVPRGRRSPKTRAPARWHHFDPRTFTLGRDVLRVTDEVDIGLYSATRSIVDMLRLGHREGSDLAYESLRRWLSQDCAQPSALLQMASHFPAAEPALRRALDVLL